MSQNCVLLSYKKRKYYGKIEEKQICILCLEKKENIEETWEKIRHYYKLCIQDQKN